ncbi:response regulator transcription factor [Methylobrevis pamukkalensis]|uniref:Transcriptional regulatory protein tctD n=1 Tax=Methylobrevis pamukkalensis TaxID=1439726 RepID=A0A1E3GYF2_9HYPH|nr:response regulator transcription factor [Methylobrevis pamukkalensis]ODN68955.1 Transcriptional regulatory protein tctD [Methylobrevis pamukkalensis]
MAGRDAGTDGMRLLLAEDAEDLGQAIERHLGRGGHVVEWVKSGTDALHLAVSGDFDAVLLDLNLPGESGTRVLESLRARDNPVPVLILTARGEIEDKIRHFQLGADDYLVKPFDLRELDARLAALQRRRFGFSGGKVVVGNLLFDADSRRALVDGRPVELSAREYRLLEYFIVGRGRVLAKEQILDHLVGLDEEIGLNAVELYVSRLRRKLEGASLQIRTIRGLGYVAEEAR